MATLFVTGGAGFIGSNFIRYWLAVHPDDRIINYDALTYAGNLANLDDIGDQYAERYLFVKGDIGNYDLAWYLDEAFAFLIHGIGTVQLECQLACQHCDDDDARMGVNRRG